MKRTYTMVEDDQQGQQGKGTLSRQGVRGDTELAHVNPWEAMLLKRLGGAGTINPQTGLRQFTTNWGTSADRNKWIAGITGYTGEFGELGGVQNPNTAFGRYASTQGYDPKTLAKAYESLYPTGFPGTYERPQPPFFNFPLDIKPYTEHTESSYAGLPGGYGQSLLQSLMPQLQTSIADMPGNIDRYTGQALGGYQQMMQDALRRNIPVAIGNLANRGIISSTEGQRVLSDVYSSAAIDAANKGYQTAMQAALLKANIPSVLAQIGELGRVTTGTGRTYQEDPTRMYSIAADLIRSMM